MVEKCSRIPEPPPNFFPGEEQTLTDPIGWPINRTPDLPSVIPPLTPPEEPPDYIVAGEKTISTPVAITTNSLRKLNKPRANLSKAVPANQIKMFK